MLRQHSKVTVVTLSTHLQVGFVDDTAALTISDMAKRAAQLGRHVCPVPAILLAALADPQRLPGHWLLFS